MLNTTSSTAAVDDDEDDEMHPPDGSKSLADAANAERVHRPNQALPLRTHAPTTTISNSRAGKQSSSWTVASSSSQMSPVHGQTVSMLVASQPQVALNQAPPETMTMQSATSSYIPRPPNAFILFRSSFIRSEKISGKVEGNHSTLSKIIGACLHLYSTRSYNTRVVFCKTIADLDIPQECYGGTCHHRSGKNGKQRLSSRRQNIGNGIPTGGSDREQTRW